MYLCFSPNCKMCVRVTNTGVNVLFGQCGSLDIWSDRLTIGNVYKDIRVRGTNNESSEAYEH